VLELWLLLRLDVVSVGVGLNGHLSTYASKWSCRRYPDPKRNANNLQSKVLPSYKKQDLRVLVVESQVVKDAIEPTK